MKYSRDQRLDIKGDSIYINRTFKYIAPLLRLYGKELINLFNSLFIKGIAIGDANFSDEIGTNLHIVFSYKNSKVTGKLLDLVKSKDYYVDDYIFSLDHYLYCLVLKSPVDVTGKFINGEYSKLYSKDIIDKVFRRTYKEGNIERYTEVYSILTKRLEYDNTFLRKVLHDFNISEREVNSVIDKEHDYEYDYPPILGEEVLNYDEELIIDKILIQQERLKSNIYGRTTSGL